LRQNAVLGVETIVVVGVEGVASGEVGDLVGGE
jgi:hypothetical protein